VPKAEYSSNAVQGGMLPQNIFEIKSLKYDFQNFGGTIIQILKTVKYMKHMIFHDYMQV
jgi:hypothetical protein